MDRTFSTVGKLKLWQKVNGAILLTFALIAVTYVAIEVPYERHMLNQAIADNEILLKTLIERDQDPLANEIFEHRVSAIALRLHQMRRLDGILEINVYDADGKLLGSDGPGNIVEARRPDRIIATPQGAHVTREKWQGHHMLRYFKEIQVIGERIGYIEIFYSLSDVERAQWLSNCIVVGLLVLILLIMAVLLNLILFRTVIRPITSLSVAMGRVQDGELGKLVGVSGQDEIAMLSRAFNTMSISLKQKDILKDHFLANISHELRTPLHGIISLSESLLDGVGGIPTRLQAKNLGMIIQSGRRLSSLVDDILDFSKMRHHDLQLQLTEVDPHSMAELSIALAQSLIGQKPVRLINAVKPGLPLIRADENRLQQIMLNLLGNAIKFTAEGEIRVDAQLLTHESADGHGTGSGMLRLAVQDTGIGIAAEQHAQIFEAFQQGDGSVQREYGGTGLGLSICKQLVELHGGRIEVESVLGHGATFFITLPLAGALAEPRSNPHNRLRTAPIAVAGSVPGTLDADMTTSPGAVMSLVKDNEYEVSAFQAAQPRNVTHDTKYPNSGSGETILVVDDEPVNVQILKNQLSLHNYRAIAAGDGIQALALLQTEKPDLILLDMMMPRMTGYEVIRRIRAIKELATVPIIMLTAKDLASDLVQSFGMGANDFVTKPFRKDELLARIYSQIKLKRAIEHLEEVNLSLERRVQERTAELERLAMIDALTGLANRRYFEVRAAMDFAEARRENTPLTLLALDIDHFKQINDSHGHAAGDVVLQQVAHTLSIMLRPCDLAARVGGEEFSMLLPGLTPEHAGAIAQRVCAMIENMHIIVDERPIAVTISVGMATLNVADPDVAALHSRADNALYRAKRGGRNRVMAV